MIVPCHDGAGVKTETSALPLRLVTLNVRYATQRPLEGEQPWRVRCPKVCSQLRFVATGQDGAFLCLQEVLHEQMLDIQGQLNDSDDDEWTYIGQGRQDGKTAGEYSPIFYRPRLWSCEQSRMYWLSETPERPSCGWDAALERVVTVGLFRHRATAQPVVVMSTHFDHLGVRARQESARLILRIAHAWGRPAGSDSSSFSFLSRPVFLGGDFNSTPDDGAYKTMTAVPGGMVDIAGLVPPSRRYGNDEFTYTSFDEPDQTPKRIDFLFVQKPGHIRFPTFSVLANRFDDGVFLSDHRAVVADIEIPVSSTASSRP
ncbi:endonuclease exonuclease phosphatase family protein [Grosmannia clavigera kw1407]|uniref:Endonuclease exonuclease phosphatase family protein n=1 Tax=Grosmannia clavigera (strain kw1407 / UAMH 11150) TaxID=655863 RepID=F0XME4_GROCL|nr:endonuclease exonuclease phosphatase family protein [Grosmannia clavigera kw1407]EFX01430.1 endonuclease exonuclease phosphatase family protein [Grosmannia clavigera kw1407]